MPRNKAKYSIYSRLDKQIRSYPSEPKRFYSDFLRIYIRGFVIVISLLAKAMAIFLKWIYL
jgi:hypothetical protein